MRRLALLLGFASLVLSIDACRTPTAMTVRVLTDVPCAAQRGITVIAAAPDEYETAPPTGRSTRCAPAGNGLYDTGRIVVSPREDGSDRIGIRAVLGVSRDAESCTSANGYAGCIVARRLLRYLPHTELTLELLLRQECTGVSCGPDTTCVGRVCRPAEVDPGRCKDGCGEEVVGTDCTTPGKVECSGGKRVTCLPNRTLQVEDCGLTCSATACVGATKTLAIGANDEAGGGTSCALVSGDVYCWGSNLFSRAGTTGIDLPAPTRLTTLPKISDIEAGGTATQVYALDTAGSVWCWGLGTGGQCGAPELPAVTPRRVLDEMGAPLSGVTRIATGSVFGCMIAASGDVLCMGENGRGQLGRGTMGDRSAAPLPIDRTGWSGRAVELSCMTNSCCLVDDKGAVACWGNNDLGQTGTGSSEIAIVAPRPVSLPRAARLLRGGDQNMCALLEDGSVTCWGSPSNRIFVDATDVQRSPLRLTALDGKDVIGLSTGMARGHYARTRAGAVLGWGAKGLRIGPVDAVPELFGATSISIAGDHGCAVIAGGIQCWGLNNSGQLGDGSPGHATPSPVSWK